MSILESFYILFKSDSSEVKKGAQEAGKSVDALEAKLEKVNKTTEQTGEKFLKFVRSANSMLASITAGYSLFSAFVSTTNYVQQLGDASRALNVNVETLEAWGHAVQRTGGTAEGFQQSLASLAQHLNTTPQVALRALPALATALSKMNQAQANMYGKSLGLDQPTIYLLQQGRREVEAMISRQKELGLTTKQEIETTRSYNNALYDLGRVFQGIEKEFVMPALPMLQKSFDYLMEHKDLIKGSFIAVASGLGILAAASTLARPALLAITAAITAFSLAYEDFQKFKEGGKSVIGDVVDFTKDKFEKLKNFQQKMINFKNDEIYLQAASIKYFGMATPSNSNQKTINVNVGDVTVNTQATDGQGVANAFGSFLGNLTQANGYFDNGVQI